MRFRCGFALALLASPTAPAQAQNDPVTLEQTLIAMERQSWVAWQHPDPEFWRRFLSDDHVEVQIGGGLAGKDEVVAIVASGICRVESYAVDHFTFRQFDEDTALLVYRASQATHCNGQAVPSPVWASSLYERRDGRWVNVLYVHTPGPRAPVGE